MLTHKISMDLQIHQRRQILYAKQGDALLREVQIELYNGGAVWTVPKELSVYQVVFCKSDGHGGAYDTVPAPSGGMAAVEVNGNVATVQIAPQVLTCAGKTSVELQMLSEDGEQITTWTWYFDVAGSVESGIRSTDYWNVQSIAQLRLAVQSLQGTTEALREVAEALAAKRKLCYFAGDVPEDDHGSPDNAAIGLFSPAPEAGDYIVGSNGYIGLVADVKDGRVLFGSTGQAIGGGAAEDRVDVTEGFAVSGQSDPAAYLASLGAGRYVLVDRSHSVWHADVVLAAGAKYAQITKYEDDALLYQYVYINGTLVSEVETSPGGTGFLKPITVLPPTLPRHAATKEYVDTAVSAQQVGSQPAYTEVQKIKANGRMVLRVLLHGLERVDDGTLELHLWRNCRHRGKRAHWVSAAGDRNETNATGPFGYSDLAGKEYAGSEDGPMYPDVPDWMPNNGLVRRVYSVYDEDGTLLPYVDVDIVEDIVKPLLKPTLDKTANELTWESCGLFGLTSIKGRKGNLQITFHAVKDGEIVARCLNTVSVGAKSGDFNCRIQPSFPPGGGVKIPNGNLFVKIT